MNDAIDDAIDLSVQVREAIDHVEEAYEFMLAYAAQGRPHETETQGASQIREYLMRFRSAMDTFTTLMPALLTNAQSGTAPVGTAFAQRVSEDASVMMGILDLLLDRKSISSDMIDNTNGLIAVRSFLTDMFFIDQVVLPPRQ